jgi:predicted GNAT family N-acyltransferase
LKNIAVRHEINGISRTYLFLEGDSGKDIVKGFFTLAVKCLAMDKQHKIPESVFMQMNVDRGVAQAYLLGQLAKADGMERGFGKEMIRRAVDVFYRGNETFGCRVVRLDCKDHLIDYYESCGFISTGKNHNGTLNQMVAII